MKSIAVFSLIILVVLLHLFSLYRTNKNPKKMLVVDIVLFLFVAIAWFYLFYPAINIHSIPFWIYLFVLLSLGFSFFYPHRAPLFVSHAKKPSEIIMQFRSQSGKRSGSTIIMLIALIAVLVYGLCSFIFSPIFRANAYASRIQVEDVGFSEIPPYRFNETAIIDRLSTQNLGDKVMGQMTDLVSQFSVSPEYSQISYQEGTYRVTPLAYEGFIKYLRNRSSGIPGYITVNTTTGETQLTRLENKMRYVPSAYFNENLYRRLRFQYPTEIFYDPTFEIDEDGNPYYVCTTYTYDGIDSRKRVKGVILFNPIDGSSQKYEIEEAPTWIDRIFPEDLVIEELNDYGKYRKGFFNSWIGQEGVIQTSEGYNYISKEGDVWLYTGMTSAVSDESNLGFMLVNLRTHKAQFTPTSGADEYSIMASAEGEVLNYGYSATFPVLVNINNKPVYLLSLKDSAGLIKMYAMVDAQDYQQVYTIKADKNAKLAIDTLIAEISGGHSANLESVQTKTITVDDIKNVVIDGNTILYIQSGKDIYKVPLTESNAPSVLFLSKGDRITIQYLEIDDELLVQSVE